MKTTFRKTDTVTFFVFIAFCFTTIIILIVLATRDFSDARYVTQKSIINFSNGWMKVEEEDTGESQMTYELQSTSDQAVVLSNTLPELRQDQIIAFKTVDSRVRVTIDGIVAYEYGYCIPKLFGNTPGSKWNFVSVHNSDSGKTIFIEITPVKDVLNTTLSDIYIGDPLSIILDFSTYDLFSGFVFFSLLFMGISQILIQLVLRFILPSSTGMLYCGIISLITSFLVLSNMNTLSVFVNNPAWIVTASSILLKLLPIPILFFVMSRFHAAGLKIIRLLVVVSMLDFFLSTILHFSNAVYYHSTLFITNYVLMITTATVIISFIIIVKRRLLSRFYTWIFAIGILSFLLTGVTYLIQSVTGESDSVLLIHIGLLLFVLSATVLSAKEIADTLQLGLKAEIIGKLVYKDGLTNISNTMAFKERIKELESTKSEYEYIGVLQFDINNLKTVNDTLGHDAGDQLIKESARLIEKAFGEIGEAYRTGGDEFTVFITKDHAPTRCSEAMLAFEKYLMQFNKNPNRLFDINIAYGVAFFKNGTDVFLRDVLKLADSRMYKRKKQMKDDVIQPSSIP